MARIKFDPRFVVIATEGIVARRHAELTVRRLTDTATEIEELVLSSGDWDIYDEGERSAAFQEIGLLEDEVPRLELYGVVVMLFAVFESVLKRLPEASWLPQPLSEPRLRDVHRNFITMALRYYRDVLGVPLFSDGKQEDLLRMLADIRSAVAHATGEIASLESNVSHRIHSEWARKYNGLRIVDGKITLGPELILASAAAVDECLRGVIKRLKESHPARARGQASGPA